MGLIRKALFVGSVGLVRPSSKKQRVAKATQRNTSASAKAAAATAKAAAVQAKATVEANRLAAARDAEEREFRHATDPAYKEFIDAKRAQKAQEAAVLAERHAEWLSRKRDRQRAGAALLVATPVMFFGLLVIAFATVVLLFAVWPPQAIYSGVKYGKGHPPYLWGRASVGAWGNRLIARVNSLGTRQSDPDPRRSPKPDQ